MKSSTAKADSYCLEKIWAPTSEYPQCSNPHYCSRDDRQEQRGGPQREIVCVGDKHNAHCCQAPGNVTCSPERWQILYAHTEPDFEDRLRR